MARLAHLPKPCSEDWAKMTPREQGRHCEKCQITLVDFTVMSDQQVVDYFQKNGGTHFCGSFRPDQVKVPRLHRFRFATFTVLAAVGLLLSSCYSPRWVRMQRKFLARHEQVPAARLPASNDRGAWDQRMRIALRYSLTRRIPWIGCPKFKQ